MIDFEKFLNKPKSLLIAPAGFGKTYTIIASLQYLQSQLSKKQLILTHTHAGVASIKDKLKKSGASPICEVETISSFSQRFVIAYSDPLLIPPIEDSKRYYPTILSLALELFTTEIIQGVINSTYSGLFVDEYQDCTKNQHNLILAISNILPTRILGDYLQGIFEFNEPVVNLLDKVEMEGFAGNSFVLDQPQRWLNGNNQNLGFDLKEIRKKLISRVNIDLREHKSIEFYNYPKEDLYNYSSDYVKTIWKLIGDSDSLLILHSNTTSIEPRKKIAQRFKNSISLIESIDDQLFYKTAKLLDNISEDNIELKLYKLSLLLFNKTEVDKWFNNNGFKRKTKTEDKDRIKHIRKLAENYKVNLCLILSEFSSIPELKCYRPEVLNSLKESSTLAMTKNISFYEGMVIHRNKIRRYGRKVAGKCIGTTLLTKGLEFDNVLIMDAQNFNCPRHLYVAMTRACKRLIIVSETSVLNPYK